MEDDKKIELVFEGLFSKIIVCFAIYGFANIVYKIYTWLF